MKYVHVLKDNRTEQEFIVTEELGTYTFIDGSYSSEISKQGHTDMINGFEVLNAYQEIDS